MAAPPVPLPKRRIGVKGAAFTIFAMLIAVVITLGIAATAFDLRNDLSLIVVASALTAAGVWAHVLLTAYRN